MTATRTRRKPTGTRLQTTATQPAVPSTPEQQKLERELQHIDAELDCPSSGNYTRYLRDRKAEIERRLAELKAGQEA